jgi:peroxiredoxin
MFTALPGQVLKPALEDGMHIKPIVLGVAAAALAATLIYRQATNDDWTGDHAAGSRAPDIALTAENGAVTRLSEYRRNLVLLNFFRSDCEPCLVEMPALDTTKRLFEGHRFKVVFVSLDSNWIDLHDAYSKLHVSLPTYLDPAWNSFRAYRLTGTPETLLINAAGQVVKHYIGAVRWTDPRVTDYINKWIPSNDTP